MASSTFTGDDAVAALSSADLVPPPRPPQFTDGATADLRDAMARFSNTTDHPARRAALVATVNSIDIAEAEEVATNVMTERLDGSDVDIVAASWEVPSYALATIFGFGEQREQIRADAEQIARVIGRNEPSSPASDAAATRLLARFSDHPEPVAAVSLLYQNHDASSGLVRKTVFAAYAGSTATSDGQTVRVATRPTAIGGTQLEAGEQVAVDLAGMPFGSGPHQCPGEALATAVATGVNRALIRAHYNFRKSLTDVNATGLPTRFIMEAPSRYGAEGVAAMREKRRPEFD